MPSQGDLNAVGPVDCHIDDGCQPALPPSGPGFDDAARMAILARTRRRIELFEQAGDDWRFAQSSKSISEDTAQEYEGRAVLELVQNGHDALHPGDPGGLPSWLICTSGATGTLRRERRCPLHRGQ